MKDNNNSINGMIDLSDIIKKEFDSTVQRCIKSNVNLKQVFRSNYEDFANLVNNLKRFKNPDGSRVKPYNNIRAILKSMDLITDDSQMPDGKIANYLSTIKAEISAENKKNKALKKEQNKVAIATATTTNNKVSAEATTPNLKGITDERFPGIFSHEKDWLDPTWQPVEFNEWDVFWPYNEEFRTGFAPKTAPDGKIIWSDFWENIWRLIYLEADKCNLDPQDKTSFFGFKKVNSQIAELWKVLRNARQTLKVSDGLNPTGIGGIK